MGLLRRALLVALVTVPLVALPGWAVAGQAPPAQAPQPAARPAAPQQPPRDRPANDPQASSGTARISGRIVASDTGQPLKNVRVTATAQGQRERTSAMTDDGGFYLLPDLPAGHYTLTIAKAGYVTLQYGQRRPRQAGTLLLLDEGQDLRNVNVTLPRGSVITGRILDEDGLPLPRVLVQVFRYVYVQGVRELAPAETDTTDDRGMYRIFDLEPGEYFVSAVVPRGLRGDLPGLIGQLPPAAAGALPGLLAGRPGRGGFEPAPAAIGSESDSSSGYAPTYYPGVTHVNEAIPVSVGLGQESPSIEFAVRLVPTAHVTGAVVGPDGLPADDAQLSLVPADARVNVRGTQLGSRVDDSGLFDIANVPPGRYYLRASTRGGRSNRLFATHEITVDGEDLTGLAIVLVPGLEVEGLVMSEATTLLTREEMTQVRMTAQTLDAAELGPQPGNANARVEENGSFTLSGLNPGARMLVRPAAVPDGWTLKAVYFNGEDISDLGVMFGNLRDRSDLRVVLTDQISELSGAVHDGEGQAITDITVVAFPADDTLWVRRSRFIKASRPDQTGQFRIQDLPPGDYYLATVEFVEQAQWFDPTFLNEQRLRATRVVLLEGESKSVNLSAPLSAR